MLILIVYDVATSDDGGTKRLRQVAQACQDYGQRVQKSVFECTVGLKEWAALKTRLLDVINLDKDSVRCYFLDADVKIEHHGAGEPIDLDGALVV